LGISGVGEELGRGMGQYLNELSFGQMMKTDSPAILRFTREPENHPSLYLEMGPTM
jgi:hypothetical protein